MAKDNISRPFVTRNYSNFDELRRAFRDQVRTFHNTARRMGFREKAAVISLREPNKAKSDPKRFVGVKLLRQQLDVIDNMIHQLQLNFPSDKSAAKLSVSAGEFRSTLQNSYKQVEDKLAQISASTASPEFKKVFKELSQFLESELQGRYTSKCDERIISLPVGNEICTAGYLGLTDVVEADTTHPTYFLIFTETADLHGSKYHVTIQPNFALPGSYGFDGSADNPAELKRCIKEQLAACTNKSAPKSTKVKRNRQ